ncbi:hypothetical protein A9R04_26455 [Nocardiopsis dassonvillei]|uniref:DUF6177 family protein n=1 Tax=Nocardiopsis dassonvillei TaxID=2014 RepID=UPI0008FCC0CE|nr:DUF6177 family protein [Nocardiopsis dassonvillei]APC37996.1 hypothetical protein A9R04_26455 [Nocardiopsis dassonvillei]
MSHDAVALLASPPDRRALTKALVAAGPDLRVRFAADGAVVELLDAGGRLVAAVQAAQRLALSAEAERLLSDGMVDDLPAQPYWVEARGAELADTDTAGAVGRFVRDLADRLGGVVWEPEPRLSRGDAFLDGSTDHPAVTARTDRAVVVVQDRPLVPMSPWLVDTVAAHGREGLRLQVVTPSTSRLTHALHSVLADPTARWVVQAPDGAYYDGFSGVPLVWDEREAFVLDRSARAEDGPHEAFRARAEDVEGTGSHLLVELKAEHPADNGLVLGEAAELLAERLGGRAPALWGTSEPLPQEWNRAALTRLCRERAPGQTWFVFTGPPEGVREEGVLPFCGTQRVMRTAHGVRESVSFAVARPAGEEHDLDALSSVVRTLTERDVLRTMTVRRAAGRPDLTHEPRWCGLPLPVGLAVGVEGVSSIGTDRALSAPVRGVPFGPPLTPSVWYRVGDGTEPDGWQRFRELMDHLHPDGARAG